MLGSKALAIDPTSERFTPDGLASVRAAIARGDLTGADSATATILATAPDPTDTRRALAELFSGCGHPRQAERILRDGLAGQPADARLVFQLAQLLQDQGRTAALAAVIQAAASGWTLDAALTLRASKLLFDCGRAGDAANLVDGSIASGATDLRLFVYSGMLALQLGQFDRARERYTLVMERDPRAACEWLAPSGLATAQRYQNADHPDFARFRSSLKRTDLSESARAGLMFALGKANDDVKQYAVAADYFRNANASAHRTAAWSSQHWRQQCLAHAQLQLPRLPTRHAGQGFNPIFVVGMPRTGSTLVASMLSRDPTICNRGELPGLPIMTAQLVRERAASADDLAAVAERYERYVRRDDTDANWFIDKHPLNFLSVDIILSMWPHAKILWTRRSQRDTALSIWTQSFADPAFGFAYDFDDMHAVMGDCERIMGGARSTHPHSIHVIAYEQLVIAPEKVLLDACRWAGIPGQAPSRPRPVASAVGTASMWQVRQPVYESSRGRWHHYAELVPELLGFDDA